MQEFIHVPRITQTFHSVYGVHGFALPSVPLHCLIVAMAGAFARFFRPRVTVFDRLLLVAQGVCSLVTLLFLTLFLWIGGRRGRRWLSTLMAWMTNKAFVKDMLKESMPLKQVVASNWQHCFVAAWRMRVKQGSLAYNCPLLLVPDEKSCNLLDLQTPGKPLVVFFASCTCPFVIDMLEQASGIIKPHKSDFDFLIIYIAEAHASDGWKLPNAKHSIPCHRSQKDRVEAAKTLRQYNLDCRVAVDLMSDEAALAYSASPDRLYLIVDGVVKRQSKRGPFGVTADTLRSWLKEYSAK